MPRYEFKCNQCQERFEISLSIKNREIAAIICPKCKSTDVSQVFSGLNIISTRSRNSGGCGCGGTGCCG